MGGVDDVAPGVVAAADEKPDEPSKGDTDLVLVEPRVGDLDLSLCFRIGLIPGDLEDEEESSPFSVKSATGIGVIPSSNSTPLFAELFPKPAVPESYKFGSLRGLKLSSDLLLFKMERLGFLEFTGRLLTNSKFSSSSSSVLHPIPLALLA